MFAAVFAIVSGCGIGMDNGVPVTGTVWVSDDEDNAFGGDEEFDTCAVNTNDQKVKLLWARSEVIRWEGTTACCSLFGDVRTEILTNIPQTAAVHYTIDGTNWQKLSLTNRKYSDGRKYFCYYFYTQVMRADTNMNPHPVIQFKVEYTSNGVSFYSDKGRTFKTCPSPDPALPNGVIGQAVLGNKHFLTENAEVTAFYTNGGILAGYHLHGHFQSKNDCNTNKTIRIVFRTNTMDWVRSDEPSYPCLYAQMTDRTFYPNGFSKGVQNWEFNLDLPLTVTNIQFIGLSRTATSTGDWHDRNKCRKYKVNPIPGTMSIYSNR